MSTLASNRISQDCEHWDRIAAYLGPEKTMRYMTAEAACAHAQKAFYQAKSLGEILRASLSK